MTGGRDRRWDYQKRTFCDPCRRPRGDCTEAEYRSEALELKGLGVGRGPLWGQWTARPRSAHDTQPWGFPAVTHRLLKLQVSLPTLTTSAAPVLLGYAPILEGGTLFD